jgi:hypothetical protein
MQPSKTSGDSPVSHAFTGSAKKLDMLGFLSYDLRMLTTRPAATKTAPISKTQKRTKDPVIFFSNQQDGAEEKIRTNKLITSANSLVNQWPGTGDRPLPAFL